MFAHDGSNIDTLVQLLNSLPYFASSSESILLKAAQSAALCHYYPGSTIILQEEPADRIYILCKGEATALRSVPFVRAVSAAANGEAQQIIKPLRSREETGAGEEYFEQEMFVCHITVGMAFPELRLPEGIKIDRSRPRMEFWPRDKTVDTVTAKPTIPTTKLISFDHDLPPPILADVTVRATTQCMCAAFTVEGFLKLATNEIVEEVLRQGGRYRFSVPALQENYLMAIGGGRGGGHGVTIIAGEESVDS